LTRAFDSSSTELEAWVDIAWIIPASPAPRVKLTSPSGLPSFAWAAGAMKKGAEEGRPRRVVEVSHLETSTKTRGRNRICRNAFVFSACADCQQSLLNCGKSTEFIVGRRGKVCPCPGRGISLCNFLILENQCTCRYLEVVKIDDLMDWWDSDDILWFLILPFGLSLDRCRIYGTEAFLGS